MNQKLIDQACEGFKTLLIALVALFVAGAPASTETAPTTAPKGAKGGKGKPDPEPEPEEEEDDLFGGTDGDDDDDEPKVTIADLKEAGQAVIKAGKSDKFKALLKKHGAENLGTLAEKDYAAVLEGLKKLAK